MYTEESLYTRINRGFGEVVFYRACGLVMRPTFFVPFSSSEPPTPRGTVLSNYQTGYELVGFYYRAARARLEARLLFLISLLAGSVRLNSAAALFSLCSLCLLSSVATTRVLRVLELPGAGGVFSVTG